MSNSLKKHLDLYYAVADRESSRSLERYFEHVVINSAPQPRRFADIVEPWQRERNAVLTPVVEHVAGLNPDYRGPLWSWWEYPRGCDKTGTLARILNWLLCYSRVPQVIFSCAADRDQAKLIYEAMKVEAGLNKWFGNKLDFRSTWVTGPGGKLEILASDGDTNQGKTPTFLVADECSVWRNSDLWTALFTTTVKRPSCACVVITNSGTLGTWCWKVREEARRDAETLGNWHFYAQLPYTHPATWMTPERIAAARKMVPTAAEAKRLFDSVWVDPAEDCGYLTRDEVEACVGEPKSPAPGAKVYLSVDYGTGGDNDRTALATLWKDGGGLVHVHELECWSGPPGSEVQIAAVEEWIDSRFRRFPYCCLVADRFQLLRSLQQWESEGREVHRIEFKSGKANMAIAVNLRTLVKAKQLVFAKDAGSLGGETLVDEMAGLVTKLMSYGHRFDHESNAHDDRTFVVGAAALQIANDAILPPVEQQRPPPQPPRLPPSPLERVQLLSHATRRGLFGLQ